MPGHPWRETLEEPLDAVGFGALNLDVIYTLTDVGAAGLRPGAEVTMGPGEMAPLLRRLEALAGPPAAVSAGGSAANTTFALARMGFTTGYVGAVGDDADAAVLLEGLGRPEDLAVARRGASGRTLIAVGADGDRSICVFPNANDTLSPEDLDGGLLPRARVLHLSAFAGDGPLEAQVAALEALPGDALVTLDPGALYARRGMEALEGLLRRADVVMPGEGELLEMTGVASVDAAAEALMDAGVGMVAVKLGGRGIHTYWPGGEHVLGAESVVPEGDSVGAGDVADAGLVAGLLLGLPPEVCTELAHRCAVRSLAGLGRASYPDRSFLEGALASMGEEVG